MSLPVIAIVGRPNVGKSTFLNACAKRLVSVVDPTEGVTRDRVSHSMVLKKKAFDLVDTGGVGIVDRQELDEDVERQISHALEQADVIIFVVDARAGVTPLDQRVARRLHELGKPVILAANKAESRTLLATAAAEFHRLGFGEPHPMSAQNHDGTQTVLEAAVAELPKGGPSKVPAADLRVAIVGRRNAGKSTLVNAFAGQDRVIVSEKPGTTRDAVDVLIEREDGKRWMLIDTAGVTQHAHDGRDPIQWYSEHRALLAIRRSDVTILLVDALKKVSGLEKRLAKEVEDNGKPCILAVNKWDLVEGTPTSEFETYYRGVLPGLDRAPIAFCSAKTRLNIQRMLDICAELHAQAEQKVSTGELNRFVQVAIEHRAPRIKSSRRARIYYATQVGTSPTRIALFVNDPDLFDNEFRRYLENRFRDTFPFPEVPVQLHFRARDRKPLNTLKSGN
jgi:GTP-binding protein